MFVGDSALYFICSSKGSLLWDAVGVGVGGLVGGLVAAAGNRVSQKETGANIETIKDSGLRDAVDKAPGSIVLEPEKIEMIKNTMWMRMIRYDGEKFGVASGYSKDLVKELGPWMRRHGVTSKGRAFQKAV